MAAWLLPLLATAGWAGKVGWGARVPALVFRGSGSGFRAQGSGFRPKALGLRVQGLGLRV